MNERIQELMLEAGKTIPGDKHIDADFCKKFAELIVRECVCILHANEKIPKAFFFSKSAHVHELAIKQHFDIIK